LRSFFAGTIYRNANRCSVICVRGDGGAKPRCVIIWASFSP
jgi:hypothetical protein